jgi:hypothetical protein
MCPASHVQPLRDPFQRHKAFPPQAQRHLHDGDFFTSVFETFRVAVRFYAPGRKLPGMISDKFQHADYTD